MGGYMLVLGLFSLAVKMIFELGVISILLVLFGAATALIISGLCTWFRRSPEGKIIAKRLVLAALIHFCLMIAVVAAVVALYRDAKTPTANVQPPRPSAPVAKGKPIDLTPGAATIEQRVRNVLISSMGAEKFARAQVTIQSPLAYMARNGNADGALLDELGLVEFIMKLEEEFSDELGKSEMPEADAEKLRTVGDVIEYFSAKSRNQPMSVPINPGGVERKN
jgi:acyl carrier protein